jgi:predicted ArsR family transcriptional regulator
MTDPTHRRAAKDALFDGFASIARALSSGRRAEIVELLAQGERTVDQIAGELDQSLANTSHHLRTLARAGSSPAAAVAPTSTTGSRPTTCSSCGG